jgi:large subunit ribosomal protein L13
MRTTFITKPLEVERKWYVVDAEGQTLGRLCTEIARVLRGKHKPIYSPHVDTGDYVIVVNAEKIEVTGKKLNQKKYVRHSRYVGSRKETSLRDMLNNKPEYVITHAVKGMLPKNRHKSPKCTLFQSKELTHAHRNVLRHRPQKKFRCPRIPNTRPRQNNH